MGSPEYLTDDELLDRFQRAAFGYFLEQYNPENGLVADTSRAGAPASIAVVGFALSCYPVGVERGWMARADALARVLVTLRFFCNSQQGEQADATGYQGFYYHFLDMKTGTRAWRCELSPIDTTLLLAGVLTARAYFSEDTPGEREIRERADAMYRRVDWQWARGGKATVRQGWKPRSGFLHYGWDGYSEATILYVLGLASPSHPLADDSFAAWTATYQWENIYDCELLYAGPLFIHQFSHAWIDFDGIRDPFMRKKNSDYFKNSQRATHVHREYARRNPQGYVGYGKDCWGITANEGPGNKTLKIAGRARRFLGYAARGVPFGPDDGTTNPCAALASLPFRARARRVGAAPLLRTVPWDDPGLTIAKRLQSDSTQSKCTGRRPVRLGFRRIFRPRSGHRRADDRELLLAADLAANAAVSLYRQRIASRRVQGRLAFMTQAAAKEGRCRAAR